MIRHKIYVIYLLLGLTISLTGGLLAYLFLPGDWITQIKMWSERNPGFLQLLGIITTVLIVLPSVIRSIVRKILGRLQQADTSTLTVEHNYLLQLLDWYDEMQRHPLVPNEDEILELQAEIIVEPKFKIIETVNDKTNISNEGRYTSNLVKTLLKSRIPVVVLGDPGAGKSVSLRKVMVSLARQGLQRRLLSSQHIFV